MYETCRSAVQTLLTLSSKKVDQKLTLGQLLVGSQKNAVVQIAKRSSCPDPPLHRTGLHKQCQGWQDKLTLADR